MKPLKDLTLDDVQALNDATENDAVRVYGFDIVGSKLIVHGRRGLSLEDNTFDIVFDSDGAATYFCNDEHVQAGLGFYVEMKRRGFSVPALDEVYHSNLQEREEYITQLEREMEIYEDILEGLGEDF